jgi:hypothetical protein
MIDGPTKTTAMLLMPENVTAPALDEAFCEEIAVQSNGCYVQSHRIAVPVASDRLWSSFFGLNV